MKHHVMVLRVHHVTEAQGSGEFCTKSSIQGKAILRRRFSPLR